MRALVIAAAVIAVTAFVSYTSTFNYYCWWRPYEWRYANSYCTEEGGYVAGGWHRFYGSQSPRQFWGL